MRINKRNTFLLIIMLLIYIFPLQSYDDPEQKFGIFLSETGELVLSEEHIEACNAETHEIELNQRGIEKWNSYMTYESIPKLAETLYNKDFVVRMDDDDVYVGKFWSMVSSSIPDCITITESLMKLDDMHNTIQIRLDFGSQSANDKDPRNDPKILIFFRERGLLK